MISIFATIIDIVLKLFGLRRAKEPAAVDLAASNATAQVAVQQEHAANEIVTSASAARSDADARVVSVLAEAKPDTGAAAGNDVAKQLREQFPADFRPGD